MKIKVGHTSSTILNSRSFQRYAILGVIFWGVSWLEVCSVREFSAHFQLLDIQSNRKRLNFMHSWKSIHANHKKMEYQTFFKVNKLCSQAYKDHMRGLQCVLRGIYDWYMTLVGHHMCWISQNCLKVSKTLCQKISNSYENYCTFSFHLFVRISRYYPSLTSPSVDLMFIWSCKQRYLTGVRLRRY